MRYPILIVVLVVVTFLACQKDEPAQKQEELIPHISSISPENGPYGTVVTIRGENFNSNANNDTVLFNDKAAVVQSATDTTLVVIVPKGAGDGQITIKTNGRTAISTQTFSYELTATVSTIAGTGDAGLVNGPALTAQFNDPTGLALDAQENIYVVDKENSCIRKITPDGQVTTFAGSGVAGFADGQGTSAQFSFGFITGLAIDGSGNLYVADGQNARVRKITPSGLVSTIAGASEGGYVDGQGTAARFYTPCGITIDSKGNLYVSESNGNRIRKITPSGMVSTFAGSGVHGDADGQGTLASFGYPGALSADQQDNIYVADTDNRLIRKITPSGLVSTYAGKGIRDISSSSGPLPTGVYTDSQNNVYIGEITFVYKVNSNDSVDLIAGNINTAGFADGPGNIALFWDVTGMIEDADGNILVADSYNANRIRKITFE